MSLQENIKLIGFVESHDEILMEVKKSRVFVLPTYADTGPRSVAEAMAIGTPVVSYNVDGMPFMVENNICGILAEKGNVKELAESIYSILSDDLLAARLSINAYDFAKEYFSLKKNTNELINIYKTIIDLEKSDENK
jgi:glycosyltransferase involved in cell wall biosynthesis